MSGYGFLNAFQIFNLSDTRQWPFYKSHLHAIRWTVKASRQFLIAKEMMKKKLIEKSNSSPFELVKKKDSYRLNEIITFIFCRE